MAVSADFLAYVVDQLAAFKRVRTRRMFGGVGLYADDLFFGLIDNNTVYFKVDDSTRSDYLARGLRPFQPFPDKPEYSMSYYEISDELLEDAEELAIWARKACTVALAAAQRKQPRAKKTPNKTRKRK